MRKNLDYLSPTSISILIVLNEYTTECTDFNTNSLTAKFILSHILRINQIQEYKRYTDFLEEMRKGAVLEKICVSYTQKITTFENINDLYKYLHGVLKNLRMMRNSRLEQGNVVDIFIRRCLLCFSQYEFQELVKLFNNVEEFTGKGKNTVAVPRKQNHFYIEKKADDLLHNILNFGNCFSFDEIKQEIKDIKQYDNNHKFYYLKFQNQCRNKKYSPTSKNLHKYFDKTLSLLFPVEKGDSYQNKIHHLPLNLCYINLKMGYLDEALRAISETLRISQNNSDDESINHCLIYLYQICGLLGYYQDEIMLVEHAISHSLTLNNPILMLYSCMTYAQFEQRYDCGVKHRDLLKARNISWTDALHNSSKKLFYFYENSFVMKRELKEKNLDIPRSLESLIKASSFFHHAQPALVNLLINTLYNISPKILLTEKAMDILVEIAHRCASVDIQKSLQLFKFIINNCKKKIKPQYLFYFYVTNIELALNRGEFNTARFLEQECLNLQKEIIEPGFLSKILSYKIDRLIREKSYAEAHEAILKLIEYNSSKGYVKLNCRQHLNLIRLSFLSGDYFKALILCQECIKMTRQLDMLDVEFESKLYQAHILLRLGYLRESMSLLKKLQEKITTTCNIKVQANLFYVKALLFLSIGSAISSDSSELLSKLDSKSELQINAYKNLNKALELYISLGCTEECRDIYYLKARILDDLEAYELREAASKYFINSQQMLSQFSNFKKIDSFSIDCISLIDIQEKCISLFSKSFKKDEFSLESHINTIV